MALPIGGFMPIPLAMMIPFMATQSMVMGDAFGQAFQYGKRKISAMSNEEFNSTTMEQLASQMFKSYQNIIPDLKQSIEQSRSLQALIVSELIKLPTSIFQEVTGSGTSPETIRTANPTPEQVNEKFNPTINIIIDKIIENFSIPNAYGTTITQDSSGKITTSGETSTFNPPEFGDQSPPKTFDKEINSAQNEIFYNERIADAKQKEYEQAVQAVQPKFRDQTQQIQDYQIKRGQLLETYWLLQGPIDVLIQRQKTLGAGGGRVLASQFKTAIAKQARAKKAVMNFITLARNITATKLQANRDWRTRVWQRG